MVSKGHTSRYESFQDEIDEDYNNHTATIPTPTEPVMPLGFDLMRNGIGSNARDHSMSHLGTSSSTSSSPQQPKKVRLRAVESEREYFLKLMNVDLFRKLTIIQAAASVIIVISQVVLYASVTTRNYKALDYVGVGLWGPLVFFSTACWLTWISTRSPSGCCIGSAMGFQITSFFVGIVLLIFSTISLTQHGTYSYWRHPENDYDPEIAGRIFCSFIILAAVCEMVSAIILSIQFCRVTCCARTNAHDTIVFDVETIKV